MESIINIDFKINKLHQSLECEISCNGEKETKIIEMKPLDLKDISYDKMTNSFLDTINKIKLGEY